MEQADRTHFEQEWRDAFEDARMTPPAHVWNGIEKSMHGSSGNRKRLFLIQLAMAASVLFAMSIGAAGVYQLFMSEASREIPVMADSTGNGSDKSAESQQEATLEKDSKTTDSGDQLTYMPETAVTSESENSGKEKSGPVITADREMDADALAERFVEGSVSSSFDLDKLDPFESGLAYDAALLQRVPQGVPYSITPRRKNNRASSWAALGVSTGNFTSGSGASDSYMLGASLEDANAVRVGRVSEESTGSVFQVEMNFGKRIARRWIVQGGVGYLERNSDGMSNIISARGTAVSGLASEQFAQAVVSEPYRIENSLQVVTVPVQVGYILVDRKVGVRLLTGIANEMMLQYKVEDVDGNLGSQSYKPGDSEEYNSYGMSALVSTEVSYTVADRYQMALQPRMRQSILPLKETDESLPRTMELGFAVRYLFQ